MLITKTSEGDMIHKVIDKAYPQKFRSFIQDGNVYIITNARVMLATQKFQPVENDMVINFMPTIN